MDLIPFLLPLVPGRLPALGRGPSLLVTAVAPAAEFSNSGLRRFLEQERFGQELRRPQLRHQALTNTNLGCLFILLELSQLLAALRQVRVQLRYAPPLRFQALLYLRLLYPRA